MSYNAGQLRANIPYRGCEPEESPDISGTPVVYRVYIDHDHLDECDIDTHVAEFIDVVDAIECANELIIQFEADHHDMFAGVGVQCVDVLNNEFFFEFQYASMSRDDVVAFIENRK